MNNFSHNIMNRQIYLFIFIIPIIFIGCSHEPDEPGWDYFPDMAYSRAYETNSDNPVFNDEKTMQKPVEGTIPREQMKTDILLDLRSGIPLKSQKPI